MTNYTSSKQDWRPIRVPDLDAEDSEILDFRDKWFNYFSVYRCRHMERMALALHYQLSRQWMELDNEILVDGVRGYAFRDARNNSEVEMPRPVTNYIAPAVEVEMASLSKRELVPNVISTSKDPRIEAAAKQAKKILDYRLKTLNWPEARELATFLTIVTGTSVVKSYWDETYSDLTKIAAPGAVSCPLCGTTAASPLVNNDQLPQLQNQSGLQSVVSDDPDAPPQSQMTNCPTCSEPVPLQPYQPSPEEADNGQDFLGRPLGVLVPKGNTNLEIVSPFEFFPQNGGVDTTPDNMKIWGQATPRDLDWIEERWPQLADKIQAETPTELMRVHPMLGQWTLLGRYDSALDSGIYDHHCRIYEVHAEKSYRFPEGRSIVLAGNTILENGPLYKTVQLADGRSISAPKVRYATARYKVRHGEFWGHSMVDDLISPQNQVNGIKAQMIETRERMGSPNLLVPEDSDLQGPEWFQTYGSGRIMRYTPSAINLGSKPEVLGGTAMPAETYRELEMAINDMKQIAGPQDVEQGEAPRNISTTSGLQLLGEQAERRRAPRERSLIAAFEKVWSHQLQLLWAFRSEDDTYETEDDDGSWEEVQFNRTAIEGQCKVEIEKQAHVDKSLYQREGTREAQADGLYRLDSQAAIKKILEYRGLPTDVNEDLNRQVDIAKQQWVDFMDSAIVPVVDESLDDFQIRFNVLGTFLLTDEGKRLEKAIKWSEIVDKIAGWELELSMAEALDQQAVMLYGSRSPDPAMAQKTFAQATMTYQVQSAAHSKMEAAAGSMAAMGEQGPMQTPAPTPPPPPIFLPAAKATRILMVWMKLLTAAATQPQPGQPPPPPPMPGQPPPPVVTPEQQLFLRFRAVVDAYRLLAQQKAMKDAMAMAPGAGGGPPGQNGAEPGLDFKSGNNPPNPVTPPPAPGVGVQHA